MKKHLIIVGFMGTGKSTIGQQIAALTKMEHIDTDDMVQRDRGCTIPEIFANYGELTFRNVETGILEQYVQNTHSSIITTGGGIVLRPENRITMNKYGWVFALDAKPQEIIRRLKEDTTRPLLQGGSLEEKVNLLYGTRKPLYQFADFRIDTSHKSIKLVTQEIMDIWFNLVESGDAK
ncbi:shikimate kinase [Shimazuella sp. AN120528]|nr:shikimate kinase [Shimazuella soli]